MRLIDADALLLSEVKRCGSIPTIGTGYSNETSFKVIVDQAPTIEAEPVNATDTNVGSKWIPVTERLPEESDGDRKGRIFAVLRGEEPKVWHWSLVCDYQSNFTHWMQLPKPPEDGGADND